MRALAEDRSGRSAVNRFARALGRRKRVVVAVLWRQRCHLGFLAGLRLLHKCCRRAGAGGYSAYNGHICFFLPSFRRNCEHHH